MSADPLDNVPHFSRELFDRLVLQCSGRPVEQVIDAAMNLIVNALRQTYRTQRGLGGAEARFNEISGKMKEVLLSHYDPVTGRVRSVIPFTQVLHAGHIADPDRKH